MARASLETEQSGNQSSPILLVIGPPHPGVAVAGSLLGSLEPTQEYLLDALSEAANEAVTKSARGFIDGEYEAFNESELLPALSRSWIDLAPVDWALLPPNKRQNLALIAGALINRACSHTSRHAIITDWRYGLLLPFWIEVIQSLGQSIKVACVVCSPQEVAASMHDSLKAPFEHCYLFYASYWLNVLSTISPLLHYFTSYQNLTTNPTNELARIRDFLLLPSCPISQQSLASALAGDSNCQHNSKAVEPYTDNQGSPCSLTFANRIYLQLLNNCSFAREDQMPIQIDQDICTWYNQSAPLMRVYDQLNAKYRQSREEALLLRAANQGYAEYFSLNGLSVAS